MGFPTYKSADGRVLRVVTSPEEAERVEADGYTRVRKEPAARGTRQPSTTEDSEQNSGSTAS